MDVSCRPPPRLPVGGENGRDKLVVKLSQNLDKFLLVGRCFLCRQCLAPPDLFERVVYLG